MGAYPHMNLYLKGEGGRKGGGGKEGEGRRERRGRKASCSGLGS